MIKFIVIKTQFMQIAMERNINNLEISTTKLEQKTEKEILVNNIQSSYPIIFENIFEKLKKELKENYKLIQLINITTDENINLILNMAKILADIYIKKQINDYINSEYNIYFQRSVFKFCSLNYKNIIELFKEKKLIDLPNETIERDFELIKNNQLTNEEKINLFLKNLVLIINMGYFMENFNMIYCMENLIKFHESNDLYIYCKNIINSQNTEEQKKNINVLDDYLKIYKK